MSNPTANYSWSYPTENTDPWFSAFDTFAAAIDTSVKSVERFANVMSVQIGSLSAIVPTRCSVVLSVYPTAALTLVGTTTITDAAFQPLSVAPQGRCVASFSILGSGGQLHAQLMTMMFLQGASQGFTTVPEVHFRLVVQPGSLNIIGNSAWKFAGNMSLVRQHLGFVAVSSLGPGTYSTELQVRAFTAVNQASAYGWNTADWVTLTLAEVIPVL